MPDPDDMILVHRDDLRAMLRAVEFVAAKHAPPIGVLRNVRAVLNGEAATVEYDMFDGKCHRRVVGPWTTQETP